MRSSSDSEPGFCRQRIDNAWVYFDHTGTRVTDQQVITRLNALALPPAYTYAWFCVDPDGHMQATGIDARGRKQYRYHPEYRKHREASKFGSLVDFGRRLPLIRRRVSADLRNKKLCYDTVLAAIVRLLDTECIRIGNKKYANENKSYGATTLLDSHLYFDRTGCLMSFTGKHGIHQRERIEDDVLKDVMRRCRDLPGELLFQYIGNEGGVRSVTSHEVNNYIKRAMSDGFTAKHFRTWRASVIVFDRLVRKPTNTKVSIKELIEPVAKQLGNTLAISRKSYVHPALLEAVKRNPRDPLSGIKPAKGRSLLSSSEAGLIDYLACS